MSDLEIVYVLTNAAMPDLVKIGRTSENDVNSRVDILYNTSVPVPFKVEFACRVPNSKEVEQALHIAFGPSRINAKREFFKIKPEQAIAILRLLHVDEATNEIEVKPEEMDAQDLAAAEKLRRRPHMNFEEMGIPVGSILQSNDELDKFVTVEGPRQVRLGDETMSLTNATKKVLNINYAVGPTTHWTFEGHLLQDIYDETYPPEE